MKTHMMHHTNIAKPKGFKRLKRDLYKAWMYPVRFTKEMFRWFKKPIKIIAFLWRVAIGKQSFTWDG